MSIRMLKYFVKIVQNDNNLTKAANELYISQPALSRMLTEFEKKNDVLLFIRSNGRLNKLTPAGEVFYEKSQSIINDYHQAINEISKFTLSHIQIKVGITTFILSDFCHSLLLDVALDTQRGRSLELVEGSAFEISGKLRNKEIDIAIIISPSGFSAEEVDEHQIYSTEVDLFLHKRHPLSTRMSLKWEDLKNTKLVIPTEKSNLYQIITKRLDEESIHPSHVYHIDSIDSIFQIIETKEFVSLLPRITKIRNNDVVKKKIESPIMWDVVMCMHKNSNRHHFDYIHAFYNDLTVHLIGNASSKYPPAEPEALG